MHTNVTYRDNILGKVGNYKCDKLNHCKANHFFDNVYNIENYTDYLVFAFTRSTMNQFKTKC